MAMTRLRSILLSLCLLSTVACSTQLAGAQVVITPPAKPKVTTDIRFAPLERAESVSTGHGGGLIRQVSKSIVATFDPANLVPGYTILHYYWGGLDFGPNGPPDAPTATGVAHYPGSVSVSCSVEIVANVPGAIPFTTSVYSSKPVYVVGGPLSLGVYNGYPGTPSRDSDAFSPVYVEYFGFDPAGTVPAGAQNPQHGTVSAYGPQPSGTTYTWSVPSPLKILSTGVNPNTSSLSLGATAGSAGGKIKVNLTYNFNNNNPNDPVSGSCPDNSAQQVKNDGSNNADAYTFDSHKPTTLADRNPATSGVYDLHNGPPANTDYGCKIDYFYQLKDDGGLPMGVVYVVERWDYDWGNVSNFIWNSNGPTMDGKITDHFEWYVSSPHPQSGGAAGAIGGPYTHRYYAATTDTSWYNPSLSGILVKTTTTTYWTNFIQN
jgi:hypothetical protein